MPGFQYLWKPGIFCTLILLFYLLVSRKKGYGDVLSKVNERSSI